MNISTNQPNWLVEWREDAGYIWVQSNGYLSAIDFLELGKTAIKLSANNACNRILIDHKKMTTDLSISGLLDFPTNIEAEGFIITSVIAAVLPEDEDSAEFIRIFAAGAVARGHRYKLFKCTERALEWLLDQ